MPVEAVPFTTTVPVPVLTETGTTPVIAVPAGVAVAGGVPFDFAPVNGSFLIGSSGVPFDFAPYGAPGITITVDNAQVPFLFDVGGFVNIGTPPSSDAEGRYRQTGRRPAMPLIVRGIGAPPVPGVADGESFLVSSSYVPVSGDGLYQNGAHAGYVGTIFGGVTIYRPPDQHEVVWYVDLDSIEHGLYRWNGSVWQPYASMPQRALSGQQLFEQLDPDGVLDYWAKLVGGMSCQAGVDNRSLMDLFDADRCPEDYLGVFANQFGIKIPYILPVVYKRQRLRTAIPENLVRGTAGSFVRRLAQLGYLGYVHEIWVNPTAATNWYALADAPSGVKSDIAAKGLTGDISPTSGQKGQDWIEVEHGSSRDWPTTYWPSGGISVHLNRLNGDPLSASLPNDTVSQIKQDIAADLADLIPASGYIRLFATDTTVGVYRYF